MIPQSIDATIFASEHPNITKRTSLSAIVLSFLLMLVGIIAIILLNRIGDQSSTLTSVLLVVGAALVIWGAFRLVRNNKEIIYTPTASIVKEKSIFFDLKYLDDLKTCVANGSFPLDTAMKSESNGNIRMDIILSRDKQFAAVQLFQFVPYAYNPVTKVHYYTNGEAAALSSFLAKCGYKK